MKNFYNLFISIAALLCFFDGNVSAQKKSAPSAAGNADVSGEISTVLTPHKKDAIFDNLASYSFEVRNGGTHRQTGKVSYIVTDQFNKKLRSDSVKVNLDKKSSHSYDFTISGLKSGFYKVNFMVNVSDYDDTTRRAFGIRPEEIKSSHPKPDDFDAFWDRAKKDLAKVKPRYKVTERKDLETEDRKVFLVEMKSLDSLTIYAWLTEPAHKSTSHQTFPVLLMLPGYQATNKPLMGRDDDMAFVGLDVRGQGLSKAGMEMRREDYIVSHLEDKNSYIMRGIVMDCIRAVDFIYSRPELSKDRIAVTGGSMGGYLSITTAALDKRITVCGPQNPFLSDIYNMDNGAVEWPINQMKHYAKVWPNLTFDKILNNLQYFDTKNFAGSINCPVVMGIGLLDPFVPPNNSYAVFNNIKSRKKLFVFKDLGHEVGDNYYRYETLFTRDMFGLFF